LTRYFLDTTAHVERWAGDITRQERVRGLLAGETHATSTHARREWKHIVEGTCVDVLNALRERPRTLSNVFARLSQGWGRSQGHRLRVLALLSGGESALDADLLEIRARAYLRYQAETLFVHSMDEVRDGSECGLAMNVGRQKSRGEWEFVNPGTGSEWCKKTDQICCQDDDLEGKKGRLQAAGQALSKSANHKRFGKAALEAVSSRAERKGKKCFGLLGDVSIALDCHQDEVVLTTDESFSVMAPALGLTVERFKPTPPP
jgi:hypothetical protein